MTTRLFILVLIFCVSLVSCRKEETELIETPEDEILEANSTIASLIRRTTTNDGSSDNIVDRANCFNIAFPYTVTVNGVVIDINSSSDYAVIECVFDQSEDSETLNIEFPIVIILDDYSEVTINSLTEFESYTSSCNGENEYDDDIECIDFIYPIEASIFNPNNELLETITIENDNQLFDFIEDIDVFNITTFSFPFNVILFDGSEIEINNFNELETALDYSINSCDEDDDYDYSDDDCDDCSISEVENLLINCADWSVNRLKRDATDYDSNYDGYDFNFFSNGTMSVFWNTTTVYGTWTASGTGNNIEVIIDVPALPLCNNNWILQEIKNCSEDTEINLVVGNDDRIQYINNCN